MKEVGDMSCQKVEGVANANHATTVDAYVQLFPDDVRAILEKTRQIVRSASPDAIETISYGIPTIPYDLMERTVSFLVKE